MILGKKMKQQTEIYLSDVKHSIVQALTLIGDHLSMKTQLVMIDDVLARTAQETEDIQFKKLLLEGSQTAKNFQLMFIELMIPLLTHKSQNLLPEGNASLKGEIATLIVVLKDDMKTLQSLPKKHAMKPNLFASHIESCEQTLLKLEDALSTKVLKAPVPLQTLKTEKEEVKGLSQLQEEHKSFTQRITTCKLQIKKLIEQSAEFKLQVERKVEKNTSLIVLEDHEEMIRIHQEKQRVLQTDPLIKQQLDGVAKITLKTIPEIKKYREDTVDSLLALIKAKSDMTSTTDIKKFKELEANYQQKHGLEKLTQVKLYEMTVQFDQEYLTKLENLIEEFLHQ